jgi:hypothetical protein
MTKDNTYSNAGGAQMQALLCQRLAAVARHLGSIEGGIEQARVVERVSTER